MPKFLSVNAEKCTGCRLCEMVCSVKHFGVSDPSRACVNVVKWELEGVYLPIGCKQCVEPSCAVVCPVNAITRSSEENRVIVDNTACIGCRACISACPFGAAGFDAESGKTFRCDLCGGNPTCVDFCATKALTYIEASTEASNKRRAAAGRQRCGNDAAHQGNSK